MVLKRREKPSHFSNMLRFMPSVLGHPFSRKIFLYLDEIRQKARRREILTTSLFLRQNLFELAQQMIARELRNCLSEIAVKAGAFWPVLTMELRSLAR